MPGNVSTNCVTRNGELFLCTKGEAVDMSNFFGINVFLYGRISALK